MIPSTALERRICVVAVMLALFASAPATQSNDTPVRYTAMAVNMGAPVRWTTLTVEMTVNRWSTEAETNRLLAVLMEKGPDRLLDMLQEMPRVGYIRTPDSIGYDLKWARRMPGEDGGEHVVLATDRYISFWEAANRPRTIDDPFTVIEIRIAPHGEGEGKMSLFAKVTAEKKKNTIILEDYGTQPVLLKAVKREAQGR